MIEGRAIRYHYPGDEAPALDDISIDVRPGEVVGVVGPNGSGKSTLGRLIKGLLLPSDGQVVVDGLHTRDAGLAVRRLVGLLFQNPNSQIVNAVIEDEVAFGPENLGLPPAEIRERVTSALRSAGLEGRERDECHSVSMAVKQRIALAAVLAMRPRYLILDEPTAWLEPASRWELLEEVRRWQRASGAGLVIVTHRMDEAQICDRLYGLLDGRLEAEGAPNAILQNAAVRERLSLEVPETYALAATLRDAGLPVVPGLPVDRLAEEICRS